MSGDLPLPDSQTTDFQTAFWAAKHDLAVATAAAFSRHGVHEGQQFILRLLWAEDGQAPGEIARQLGLAPHGDQGGDPDGGGRPAPPRAAPWRSSAVTSP